MDREKVIKDLEFCVNGHFKVELSLATKILAMLKEQDAVEPKEIVNEHFPIGDYRRTIGWLCGKCGKAIMGNGQYCSYCGTKVKWE